MNLSLQKKPIKILLDKKPRNLKQKCKSCFFLGVIEDQNAYYENERILDLMSFRRFSHIVWLNFSFCFENI